MTTTTAYTMNGGSAVEERVALIVRRVASVVSHMVAPEHYKALLLFGGYGRGEGGVEIRDDIESPHNNLDFILVTRGLSAKQQAAFRGQIADALVAIRTQYGVGVDISTISENRLRRSPSLVMWYDMRFGHRTILGDSDFAPSLTQFSIERIPSWDIRNLMVNRGTLFVINDWLLSNLPLDDAVHRTVIKHIMKGVIGYGDAWLFHEGRYDWSYAEKQGRMLASDEAPVALREWYAQAISFRFRPSYPSYWDRDPTEWMDMLRPVLADVHLACENNRLGKTGLSWRECILEGLKEPLWSAPRSPRGTAKLALNWVRGASRRVPGSRIASWGARAAGLQGVLPVLFPVIAYDLRDEYLSNLAAELLGSHGSELNALRRRYLQLWGTHGDDNFVALLDQHKVTLHGEEVRG